MGDSDAGVVHQTIQLSEPGHGMIDHLLDAGLVGDIGLNEAQGGATFRLQCMPFGFAATSGNNARTLGDKHFRDAFADATSRTCYDSDLSAESAHFASPPVVRARAPDIRRNSLHGSSSGATQRDIVQ
jgi:hypothetical protein